MLRSPQVVGDGRVTWLRAREVNQASPGTPLASHNQCGIPTRRVPESHGSLMQDCTRITRQDDHGASSAVASAAWRHIFAKVLSNCPRLSVLFSRRNVSRIGANS